MTTPDPMHCAAAAPPAPTLHPMPFVRIELVALSVIDDRLHVLLSHRKEAPYKGRWGLPGGVLRIDLDASLEAAAHRVAAERLNRALPNLGQVAAVGGAKRDPRAPWALSVVYRSLVQPTLDATPGKRVQALAWRPVDEVAARSDLAFDHTTLVAQAVEAVRREIRELRLPAGWAPDAFTLGELQGLCEAVLGERLDKVTFRRRIDHTGVAVAIAGKMRAGGAHRPAQLYTLAA
ncbi:MAG TPA: NUDIX domain-containing protein [Quisquiliibacterium sp.]|nr:NUDIX domain-containing protein [Quisquiliibacterium sp.]HQP68282.1 NUDIX domain-containing protein [Quisquiliibacterium sp.]